MHQWEFRSRFRRHAFGRRSQPSIQRIRQAVTEIKHAARRDPVLGAEGAALLLERIFPALETSTAHRAPSAWAVNNALDALVPLIAEGVADVGMREGWLNRLWAAIETDEIPYLDRLPDYWGDLCGSTELAALWADRLIGITRLALSPDPTVRATIAAPRRV
jgi:hypothetical protein